MSFNVINASKKISDKYKRYLKTIFNIKDPFYNELFTKQLDSIESFSKGPFLDVVDSFEKGETVENLIKQGFLHSDFNYINNIKSKTLYKHQEVALKKSLKGNNLVISTGTGSGKTECFLIPIINDLMIEKEKNGGVLQPGVRALIIYPMNALANDQIERLRGTLENYPDITFGCYTGQTEEKYLTALYQYKKLNKNKETGEELLPIKNELISREEMKENPPNILITNYAMLEYLMLRPADSVFFDGEYSNFWKYIVLDEAHTYMGSTGIEVSMLMRRVIAKLNNPKIQYILTSATLGDESSNEEVVEFATRLCNAKFDKSDIIRAYRVNLLKDESNLIDIPLNFYTEVSNLIDRGYDDNYILEEIEKKYNYHSDGDDLSVVLYDLLIKDKTYWKIKTYLKTAKSTADICNYMNWESQQLSDFVLVASHALKDGTKLFDSRYHLFVRATEGVFITLNPHKNLFLSRKNFDYYQGKQYKVFEAVTCSQCHDLYLIGNVQDNYLVQKSTSDVQEIKTAFYIGDKFNDSDDDNTLENENLEAEAYELCPYCGYIRKEKVLNKHKCEHNELDYVKIIKVNTSKISGRVTKCISCESVNSLGILRSFFTGQDASTSVIGTALFEEMPDYEQKVIIRSINDSNSSGFEDDIIDEKVLKNKKAKQFIAFSDSRQAAAYFSTYFSETYDGLLYGKILNDIIKTNQKSLPIPHFIKDVTEIFKQNNICQVGNDCPDFELEAWKALLKELVDNKSRHSLMGLGLMSLDISNDVKMRANGKFNLSEDEVKIICLNFIIQMLNDSAMYYEKNMSEADKEFFTHNGIECRYLLYGSNLNYCKSFMPKNENKTNKRVDYIDRVFKRKGLDIPKEEVFNFLNGLWEHILIKNELLKNVTVRSSGEGYRVNLSKLVVGNNRKWYVCSKCKRLTTNNILGVCPTYKCDGELQDVNIDSLEKDNHYYRMYNDLQTQPIRIVEHTAQLSRDEAYKYQNMFKQQKLDVLSCSTTFEMGVDVGNLETVFMRNMPPSPSNYIQRAGRAGRNTKSAAFALTFCNKSNHDFNYFKDPISMINGVIKPPLFKIENEKICIRHLYSAALSYFWKLKPTYFSNAGIMMEGMNVSGYEKLREYLYSKPVNLKNYLKLFLPKQFIEEFKIEDFGWVDWLFEHPRDDYPNLKKVYEVYMNEIGILLRDKQRAFEENNRVDYISAIIRNFREEDIISFLSKNGILPKYGFPVDTVELEVYNRNGFGTKIDLSRDLSMAISEYAPGCQIVADGKLITSRYIKKHPKRGWRLYDYYKCPNCLSLNILLHSDYSGNDDIICCSQCKQEFKNSQKRTFLVPDFGFVADYKIEKPTLIKPERTYRTEATFVNYGNNVSNFEYDYKNFLVNVDSMDNGSMAIMTSDEFFVCPSCGFSKETIEVKTNKNSNIDISFLKHIEFKHKDMYGKECSCNRLDKFSLGYRFETDILILRFNATMSQNEAISILQALILGACKVLDVDNREIAGCLQYYKSGIYNFILYDKTPGGAGHVKRLNTKDKIYQTMLNSFNIANNCNCGDKDSDSSCYGCLRTYQNQKYHDIIKRKYVIDFFKGKL